MNILPFVLVLPFLYLFLPINCCHIATLSFLVGFIEKLGSLVVWALPVMASLVEEHRFQVIRLW